MSTPSLHKTRLPLSEELERVFEELAAIPVGEYIEIQPPVNGQDGKSWLKGLQKRVEWERKRRLTDASLGEFLTANQERSVDPIHTVSFQLRQVGEDWVLRAFRPGSVTIRRSWDAEKC